MGQLLQSGPVVRPRHQGRAALGGGVQVEVHPGQAGFFHLVPPAPLRKVAPLHLAELGQVFPGGAPVVRPPAEPQLQFPPGDVRVHQHIPRRKEGGPHAVDQHPLSLLDGLPGLGHLLRHEEVPQRARRHHAKDPVLGQVLLQGQVNYIHTVLELLSHPENQNFRWNCETWFCVEKFLEEATPQEAQALFEHMKAGRVGFSATYLNFCDLVDSQVLHRRREAQRRYALARRLEPQLGEKSPALCRAAEDNLLLYAEHTWGHSSTITNPYDTMVLNLDARKSSYASKAHEAASQLLGRTAAEKGDILRYYNTSCPAPAWSTPCPTTAWRTCAPRAAPLSPRTMCPCSTLGDSPPSHPPVRQPGGEQPPPGVLLGDEQHLGDQLQNGPLRLWGVPLHLVAQRGDRPPAGHGGAAGALFRALAFDYRLKNEKKAGILYK